MKVLAVRPAFLGGPDDFYMIEQSFGKEHPAASMFERLVERTLGQTQAVGRNIGPGTVEKIHELNEAFPFRSDQIGLGNPHVVEVNSCSV